MLYLIALLQAIVSQPSTDHSMAHPALPHWKGMVPSSPIAIAALNSKEEGAVSFIVDIDAKGAITACRVTQGSGSDRLDQATCPEVRALLGFAPAADAQGRAIAGTYGSRLKWQKRHE